jgi:hypothetical protein
VTRSSKIFKIVVIQLFISILQPIVFAQAINSPTEQANIQALHTTGGFVSGIHPYKYYTNPNTGKFYYLIGSINQGAGQDVPSLNSTVLDNNTNRNQIAPNATSMENGKNETVRSFANGMIPPIINIYNTSIIINYKNETIPSVAKGSVPKPIPQPDPGYNILVDDFNNRKPSGQPNGKNIALEPNIDAS